MIRSAAWLVLVGAVLTSTALAADEIPLDKLKPEDVVERMKKAFEAPGTKAVIDGFIKGSGVAFTVKPEDVAYSKVDGKVTWRYGSPAPLVGEQPMKVKEAMRQILVASLVQFKVDGKGLLLGEDADQLAKGLEPVPAMTAQNTRPRISPIDDATTKPGAAATVQFTVADKETPLSELRLAGNSSNPELVDPSQMEFTGVGANRRLTMTPTATKTGTARITVTVTDGGGLSASTTFLLTVKGASAGQSTARRRKVTYYYAAPGYWGVPANGCGYWAIPVVFYYDDPGNGCSSDSRSREENPDELVQAEPVRPELAQRTFSVVRRKLLLKNNKSPEDAPGLYLRAVQAYAQGERQEALDLLAVAVSLDGQDARYWQYKALCERALGDQTAALASARRGAALELLGNGERRGTVATLERISEDGRRFLRAARDGSMTRDLARRIVAEPVPDPLATRAVTTQTTTADSAQVARQR